MQISKILHSPKISIPDPSSFRIKGLHPFWLGLEPLRSLVEWRRTAREIRHLDNISSGQGEPIVLVPLFPFGITIYEVLSSFFKQIGYSVIPLLMPLSISFCDFRSSLFQQLEELAAKEGKLILVGYWWAGAFARDFAAIHPEMVRVVITLGAPPLSYYQWLSELALKIPLHFTKNEGRVFNEMIENQKKIAKVQILNLWSATDGFIGNKMGHSNQECCPKQKFEEVFSSHLGMPFNWNVLQTIARLL